MHLYRFKFLDPLTGKWLTARHRATKEEIAARYKDFELLGEPEVRPSVPARPHSTPRDPYKEV